MLMFSWPGSTRSKGIGIYNIVLSPFSKSSLSEVGMKTVRFVLANEIRV